MDFTSSQPLAEILAALDAKTPIGSVLRTAAWEAMPQELRDSAFFSAGVTQVQFLAAQQVMIRDMLAKAKAVSESGQTYWAADRSRFIRDMRLIGAALNVPRPEGRMDGDGVERIRESDVTDPLSIARLKLVVNTQLEMAYGEGAWKTGLDADILDEWPALELVRISARRVPRDWLTRWKEAADSIQWEGVSRAVFTQGRMIALKTSRVWVLISRFGKPHPPYDFNSGMGVEEVDRDTAESFDLVKPGQKIEPPAMPQESLKASLKGTPNAWREGLQKIFGEQIDITGDEARWKPKR
jgi:hypothetical protein